MRVFLVDFENVKSDGLRCVDCLDEGDQVITFFSKNAESMSMDTYFNLIHSKASFYAVRLDRTGSNALDFQLVSYLGYLMGTSEHQDVFVISKDHGFYSAVSFCRNFLIPQSKYHKTITQYPSIASLFPDKEDSRPIGINAIPLFIKEESVKKELMQEKPVAEVKVIASQPKQESAETAGDVQNLEEKEGSISKQEIVQKVIDEVKQQVSVHPKRCDSHHQKEYVAQKVLKQEKKHSDWDEFSAAEEAGIQFIDMFGATAPVKSEPTVISPVKEVKEEIKSEEIKPEIKTEEKPVEELSVEEVAPQESKEIIENVAEEVPVEISETSNVNEAISGAEIDKMLEEFLEEAAATLEQELKDLPDIEEKPEFIEVGKPQEATSEVSETSKSSTKSAEETVVKAQTSTKKSETKLEEKPKRATRKNSPRKTKLQEEKKPEKMVVAKSELKETPHELSEKKSQPAARELVMKVLNQTLQMQDEQGKDDLEKLADCILTATGKQDLYRMIIKLFGQKTGLEYYKVVKREYTNICNQIQKM